MLAEFATREILSSACSTPMAGVCVYRFDGGLKSDEIPVHFAPEHYEVFFCLNGTLTLTLSPTRTQLVMAHDILLLCDAAQILSAQATHDLSGLLVAVDGPNAGVSLSSLADAIGIGPLDLAAVARRMQAHKGCAVIGESLWAGAAFANFAALSLAEQSRYAVFKALELLYLLSTHDLLTKTQKPATNNNILTQIVQEAAGYMRRHLDERLTIDDLSTRFGVSPTAFKKEFRRLYGQPVHAWLQDQRLTRAAMLLHESSMTVLEVAQEVGYSSTSQFSAAFLRRFGTTPGQYRRISV